MEYYEAVINANNPSFLKHVSEEDAEKASYSYLISTVVLMVGLPFPLLNMIATFIFYMANRRKSYFVRFHCLQSLLSQILIVVMNSTTLIWLLNIVFQKTAISNFYFGFLFTVILLNLTEFIISIYASIQVRKRKDVRYFFFGPLTEVICKP